MCVCVCARCTCVCMCMCVMRVSPLAPAPLGHKWCFQCSVGVDCSDPEPRCIWLAALRAASPRLSGRVSPGVSPLASPVVSPRRRGPRRLFQRHHQRHPLSWVRAEIRAAVDGFRVVDLRQAGTGKRTGLRLRWSTDITAGWY